VFGYLGVNEVAAMGAEPGEGSGFVLAHKTAVADDIGRENGCQPTLDPLSTQRFVSPGRSNVINVRPTLNMINDGWVPKTGLNAFGVASPIGKASFGERADLHLNCDRLVGFDPRLTFATAV
jgi:hypothetical protein